MSLPGLEVRAGATILAEAGDGSRFDIAVQLASYAGPRLSGISIRGVKHSRRGNHRLKNALFLSAFCALRDPVSRHFYHPRRVQRKQHNETVICLARRSGDVVFAMLRTATHYDPEHAAPGSMAA